MTGASTPAAIESNVMAKWCPPPSIILLKEKEGVDFFGGVRVRVGGMGRPMWLVYHNVSEGVRDMPRLRKAFLGVASRRTSTRLVRNKRVGLLKGC